MTSPTDTRDDARHTKGPWEAEVREMSRAPTIWIADEQGREVVRWMGFDGNDHPIHERIANARRIVQCVNAHDELERDALRYRFLRDKLTWDVTEFTEERGASRWGVDFVCDYGATEHEDNVDAAVDAAIANATGRKQ